MITKQYHYYWHNRIWSWLVKNGNNIPDSDIMKIRMMASFRYSGNWVYGIIFFIPLSPILYEIKKSQKRINVSPLQFLGLLLISDVKFQVLNNQINNFKQKHFI